MTTDHPTSNSEHGMALLMVLGIVAATTLLTAHLMTIAETIAQETAVVAMTSKLRLQVESAVDTALWMHLTDRRLFASRNLGDDPEERENISDFEPWMLDGREHEIDDNCYAYLNDAIKSFSVDRIDQLKNNFDEDDTDGREDADAFIDVYNDYVDSNNFLNLNGKEADDYAADGFPTLPRNDKMQFKAELYWLDNWQNVITSDITVIPPQGITISTNRNTKPNFFTCSETEIANILERDTMQISDAQINEVIEARRIWQEEGTPLQELIDGDLLITVKAHFSFTESNYAEITAVATAYDGAVTVRRTVTREVNASSRSFHSDRQSQTLSIWEARNF